MPVRLLHLSDLQLSATGVLSGRVDPERSLVHVLEACAHLDGISAIVVAAGRLRDDHGPRP